MRYQVAAAALVFATIAHAQDAAITVALKTGAQYHGELVEKVPDDHVTIKLATGEVKTFQWDELQLAPPRVAPPPKPKPTGTRVHIETSDEHVVLQRYAGGMDIENVTTGREETADAYAGVGCEAPCDSEIAPGSYRLKAPGKSGTDVITISGERISLVANMHDSWHHWARWTFLSATLITGLVGGALIGVGVNPPTILGKTEDYSSLVAAGAAFLAGSAVFLGLSIYCFATTTSSVTIVEANGNAIARRVPTFAVGVTYPF